MDAIFSALADPTRRAVLRRLSDGGPATPTQIAAELPVTRQAVTKHLRSLDDAGLVACSRSGRETRYEARPAPLTEVIAWIAAVGQQWDRRLSALEGLLSEDPPPG